MNRQVRRVTLGMLVLFGALFVNLNLIQLLRANELANHPANRRLLIDEYQHRRGPIVVGEEQVAFSVPTEGKLKYQRRYRPRSRYAHLLGFYSLIYGRAGLEGALNETLTGTPSEQLAGDLARLLGQRDPVGNTARLTIDRKTQEAAEEALGDRIGAVVALDPRSGAVLAQVSHPTYDPNRLSSHDPQEIRKYWARLQQDDDQPLADRAIQRRYAPGSTFKLVVAAAALEHGLDPSTAFRDTAGYTPPQTTKSIGNYGGGTCAGGGSISLAKALVVSCNTVFARLGVELGADAVVTQAERFGFNRRPPYELDVVESVTGEALTADNPPAAAQSAIGARDVQATAMQMALVAAAISNSGVLPRPHVVAEVLDPSGRQIRGAKRGPWVEGRRTAQAMSPSAARTLADLMVDVVKEGTGQRAAISGVRVGGKTGTADPDERVTPNAWFVGFAGDDTAPEVAVAVVLPQAGEGATGGGDAAPIARSVMAAVLDR